MIKYFFADFFYNTENGKLIKLHAQMVVFSTLHWQCIHYQTFFDIFRVILILNTNCRASIQPILERRGMDIHRVNVFVEASNTPLPLDCECFLLGGNTLNIKGEKKYVNQKTPDKVLEWRLRNTLKIIFFKEFIKCMPVNELKSEEIH